MSEPEETTGWKGRNTVTFVNGYYTSLIKISDLWVGDLCISEHILLTVSIEPCIYIIFCGNLLEDRLI